MKKLILSITVALFTASVVSAQTNETSNLLAPLNFGDMAKALYNKANEGGLFSASNYAIEPYLTYAPDLASGDKVGAGVLVGYNLNAYVAGALGVDYLGRFSLVSGNLTLRYPINLGSKINPYIPDSFGRVKSFADEVTIVPFILGGVGIPCSGSSGTSSIADVGGYIQYGHLWGGKFNTGVCWGKWMNAGEYSGQRYHIFAGWSRGF